MFKISISFLGTRTIIYLFFFKFLTMFCLIKIITFLFACLICYYWKGLEIVLYSIRWCVALLYILHTIGLFFLSNWFLFQFDKIAHEQSFLIESYAQPPANNIDVFDWWCALILSLFQRPIMQGSYLPHTFIIHIKWLKHL